MSNDIIIEITGTGSVALGGPGPWTLGRASGSDVCFADDPQCSRLQAVIHRTPDGLVLEVKSANTPTYVNDRIIRETVPLKRGDTIRFATQRLRLQQSEPAQARRAPSGASSAGPNMDAGQKTAIYDGQIITRQDNSRRNPGRPALVLDHPTVSRRHARFRVQGDTVLIEDLGSTNGTHVNGRMISRKTRLTPGDVITIGIFSLHFDGQAVSTRTQGESVSLVAENITKTIRPRGSQAPLTLINHVSVDVQPGELVCIIGQSGSGKSTLMNIISGRKRPSRGRVTLGEFDIHAYFDALKQNMAYVPQSDLLHEVLTLRQALNFVAELRLPRDTPAVERNRIVEDAAASVGLAERLDIRIASLSGGQKKRASLASEILSRPNLLFLDEVTSGLDESTDREIMMLLRRLTERGMTIICVTHTLANIQDFADKVIVMAEGGVLAYAGTPTGMLDFFDIRHLGQVFGALSERGAEHWRRKFEGRHGQQASRSVTGHSTTAPEQSQPSLEQQARVLWHQFSVLTLRNTLLLLGDTRTLIMAAVQSVVVGVLLGYAYGDFGSGVLERDNSKLSFLLVLGITCLWIGCAGAAKDIVGELAIYLRERDINLSTIAFVLSKFLVTSAFTIVQIALLMLTCWALAESIPGPNFEQFLLAALASIAGVSIGLFISSLSNSRDQAAVIVPLALAPQLILGSGLVTTLSGVGKFLAKVLIGSYWARQAMTGALVSSETIHKIDPNTGRFGVVTTVSVSHSVSALMIQIIGWVIVTVAIMYWRHSHKSE